MQKVRTYNKYQIVERRILMNKNNKELMKLVSENPNHELQFFVAENDCEHSWNSCQINSIKLETMAVYEEEQWLDEDDYEERLYCDLSDKYDDEDELKNAVELEMLKVEFKSYICVFLN